jgi:dGTPase
MSNAALDQTSYNYCALPLADYACRPDLSRGRFHEQEESKYRTCFQRDRDRIVHSSAFRRLKHKTQVFVYHEGDHYRTRLTHSLEVAQIARTMARALMVNEDLSETVALAHDLGHTPFAHVGEDVLKECMKDVEGFDHNDQSLRVITVLERKYPGFSGLNLTWETLEGVAKHNGPLVKNSSEKEKLPVTVKMIDQAFDLQLDTHASVEAQVAAIADDIAYNNHDMEDGLRAGLFTLDDLKDIPLLGEALHNTKSKWGDESKKVITYQVIREVIGAMVEDVVEETQSRLNDLNASSPDDVRAAGKQMVVFSEDMYQKVEAVRSFLWERMYRHYKVRRMRLKVSKIVEDLYNAFMKEYNLLPDLWQKKVEEAGGPDNVVAQARVVADYIAGMTDRYALKEYERLFELYWDLR